MKDLEGDELKEVLIKSWLTHDSMWFYHCLKRCGIEKTNEINKAAVRDMAKIEAKRLKNAFGTKKIETFNDLKNFLIKTFDVVKAKFMDFDFKFPIPNRFNFTMNNCFAYEGVKRIGCFNSYDCAIFERFKGWFDELGVKYTISPQVDGCMMNENGNCYRNFTFCHLKI